MRLMIMSAAGAIALAGLAPRAHAQVTDKKVLTLAGAQTVAEAAEAEARRLGAPGGAIAVVDDGGQLLYMVRLDDTFPAAANIATAKARTAALFRRPSKDFEDAVTNGRQVLLNVADAPLQGGVPIRSGGAVVGDVGVSGAATAAQDEELARAGAAAFEHAADVTHIQGPKVAAAFAKGQPLAEVGNYKIHASRRDAPGQAEVHTADTDIIYVLDGTATLVTGGDVLDGRTTAPEELRGAGIRGGESRRLAKGDVVVVPRGTPHWFKEVRAPFLYYVVKVR